MSIKSLLPINTTYLEKSMLESCIDFFNLDVDIIKHMWNIDACPAELLYLLAQHLQINLDDKYSDYQQRDQLRDAFMIHSQRGTIASIRRVLKGFGFGEIEVIEVLDGGTYNGNYCFDASHFYSLYENWAKYSIKLYKPITITQAGEVKSILKQVAPARCHLVGLAYEQALNLYKNSINYNGAYTHGVV